MKPIDSVEPADCYVHATHLAAVAEQLRRELGRHADARAAVKVAGASPRECWFAALAVHHKAVRLAAEWGVDPSTPIAHAPAVDRIKPGHVLQVIDAAARHVTAVHERAAHGAAAPAAPAREGSRTPSDVFGVLATLSRQLDHLLEKPTTPGEVHQQVTLALCYAERLCGDHAHAQPAFEGGKLPSDCLRRLHEGLDATRALIKKGGHPALEPGALAGDAHTRPADCFDLATLVLGELAFLHALAPDTNPPAPYEHVGVGHKLPSHVYQLAGALTATIARIK